MCFKFHIYLFGRGYPYPQDMCGHHWMTELSVLSFRNQALVLSFDYKGLPHWATLLALHFLRVSLRRLQIRYHNLMIEWGVNWSLMQNVSFCVNICYCFKQQDSFSKDSITWALGEALIISGKSYNLSVTQSLYLKKTCLTGMRVRWVSMCKALADIWNRF